MLRLHNDQLRPRRRNCRRLSKRRRLVLHLLHLHRPRRIRIARNALNAPNVPGGLTTHRAQNTARNHRQRIARRHRRPRPFRVPSRTCRRARRPPPMPRHRRRNVTNKPSVPNHGLSNARNGPTALIVLIGPTGNSACLKPAPRSRNAENAREYAIIAASET